MRTYTDPEMRRAGSLAEFKRLAEGAPRAQVNPYPTPAQHGTSLATGPGQGAQISRPSLPTYGVREVQMMDPERVRADASRLKGSYASQMPKTAAPLQPTPRASLASRALRAVASPAMLGGMLALESRPAGQGADWDASFASYREAQRNLNSAPAPDIGKLKAKTLISDADVEASPTTGIKYRGGIGYKDGKPVATLATTGEASPTEGEASPNRIWKSVGKDGRVTYSNTPVDGGVELTQANMRGTVNMMSREAFMAPPPGTPGLAARAAIMERNIAEAEAAGDPRAANAMRAELNRLSEMPESEKTMRQSLADIAKMPERTFDEKFAKRNAMGLLDRRLKMEQLDQQQGQLEAQGMAQRRIEGLQGQLMEAYGNGDTEAAARIEKQLSALVPQQRQPDRKFVGNFRDVADALSVPVEVNGEIRMQRDPERIRQFYDFMLKNNMTDTNEAIAAFMAMQPPVQNPKVMSKTEHAALVQKYGQKEADRMLAQRGMIVEG